MQFVPVDNTGNLGAILEMPDPPSLVIFLPTMLLVTRVTRDISIKPGKCDCLAEELTADRRCRRVVLKSSRNYIQSYRTAPTKIAAGYNLCSAGRFQKDGMTEVEKLKRIIIDFQSVDDRLRFVKHYVELQEISRLNERGVA
jgi:protein involved in ribonucleotide reduction